MIVFSFVLGEDSDTTNGSDNSSEFPNFFMFPNFLEVQDVPVQSDGSGIDDSEFHNFVGKFVILPEDEEADLLETSLDLSHHLEDPHSRAKVSYTVDGTKVIQHEPGENITSSNESQKALDNQASSSSQGHDSGDTVVGQKSGMSQSNSKQADPTASGDFDVNKQSLQVSYAADGTKIIQHAPTALPPSKYKVTKPVPGPKPPPSIHYGIRYPKPNTTQTKYYRKDGTVITQFNTGIKDDNGTKEAGWDFIENEHVPGFSDDVDAQPNAAGYKYRNRAGEKEKGKLIKEQINEAINENNPTYQFKSEEDVANNLNKPSRNKTDSSPMRGKNGHLLKSSPAEESAKSYQADAVLYDARPLKPHRYMKHTAENGRKRGTSRKYHKEALAISAGSQRMKMRRKDKIRKMKLLSSLGNSTVELEMMPPPDIANKTEVKGKKFNIENRHWGVV